MTKRRLKSLLLALLMGITAVFFPSCSKEETYRLVKINSYDGEVSVQREEKLNAFEGLQLVSNDTVSVGDKSFLELLADSDKHIAAEENTGFVLHSTGDDNNGDITIDLLYGRSLFTIDNKLNEGSTFAVNTPNATLSVRGTSFSVAYDEETKTTDVEVYSGTVQLNSGDEEMLIEKDGTASIISTDEGVKIIANSAAGNPNAIAVPENTEKLFEIAMKYPQQEGYSALNAEYQTAVSDYAAKETGVDSNSDIFKAYIEVMKKHNTDISKYFEENKANAVANTNKQQDVTDWFKEKITVGDKEFRIDKAIMDMSIYGSNIKKKYITSDTYKVNTEGVDMYFCANGVEISFYGGFEKAAVVTTTTATTTTTVPETTVPETTTVETTTTTAATTVAPVTTTTTKVTTKKDTVEIPKESEHLIQAKENYSVYTDSLIQYSSDFLTYTFDSDGNHIIVELESGGTYYDYFIGSCSFYEYGANGYEKLDEPKWNIPSKLKFPHEDIEAFGIDIRNFMHKHEDKIIAMYRKHENDGFITVLKNSESNTLAGKTHYNRHEEFDATDWFPEVYQYELGDDKFEFEFDKVVADFYIHFIDSTSIISEEGKYILKHPVTGDTIMLTGFDIRYDFYGSCKKIK